MPIHTRKHNYTQLHTIHINTEQYLPILAFDGLAWTECRGWFECPWILHDWSWPLWTAGCQWRPMEWSPNHPEPNQSGHLSAEDELLKKNASFLLVYQQYVLHWRWFEVQYGTKFDCLHLLKVQVSIRQNPAARGLPARAPAWFLH